jgi:hypothetical protein
MHAFDLLMHPLFSVKVLEDAVVAPDPVSGRGADSVQRLPRGGHMVRGLPQIWNHLLLTAHP